MTPLFLSAPRVTLASTSCTAAAVSHDIWVAREGERKKDKEEDDETRRRKK